MHTRAQPSRTLSGESDEGDLTHPPLREVLQRAEPPQNDVRSLFRPFCRTYVAAAKAVLADEDWSAGLTTEYRRGLTPLFWAHVGPYGEVKFDISSRLALSAPERLSRPLMLPAQRSTGSRSRARSRSAAVGKV
jgi:hypothetical protein